MKKHQTLLIRYQKILNEHQNLFVKHQKILNGY